MLHAAPSLRDQVAAGLRRAIGEGRYPADRPLPPYRALAKSYGVSIATISEACGDLEEEGLVVRRQRRGVFPRPGAREQVAAPAPVTLQCINFISNFLPKGSAAVHVGSDYLAGFSEALEQHPANVLADCSLALESDTTATVNRAQSYFINSLKTAVNKH